MIPRAIACPLSIDRCHGTGNGRGIQLLTKLSNPTNGSFQVYSTSTTESGV